MRCAFFVLQPYLTNVWKLSFTHAAAIVNIWEGTSLMLPAVFQLLADKYLGNFKVVVFCSIASTLGLGLVTMSLPAVLDSPCKTYELRCIDDKRRALLYMGVVLTAFGRAGVSVCVPALHDEQGQLCCCGLVQRLGSTNVNFALSVAATLIISVISSWTFRFGFPAIFAVYVTLSFLGGWSIYNKSGPKRQGSLLSTVIKVFTGPRPTTQSRGITCCCISTNRSNREDDPVSLHEYSFVRHITAISITYIILGIVSALGNTFFVEQANHMNRKLLFLTIPLAAFQLPMLVGTIAWPCFYTICQCLRWFYLVGCVDFFFRSSIEAYYHAQAPGSLRDRYDLYTDFVSGLGFVSSVVLVAIVGKISEMGGKSNWFKESCFACARTSNQHKLIVREIRDMQMEMVKVNNLSAASGVRAAPPASRFFVFYRVLSTSTRLLLCSYDSDLSTDERSTRLPIIDSGACASIMGSYVRISVKGFLVVSLLFSNTLMRCAFFVLQPYLTNVWKLSFTHAAAIVNIWEGTSLMLPAVFQLLADKYLGNFKVVVFCSIASTLGLGLVTMSLPPVLDSPCKKYELSCIDDKRRALLYMGVVLTAFGRAGVSVCVPALHDEQGQLCCCGLVQRLGSTNVNFALSVVATLIISVISSWTFRFGFPAIFAAYVTLCFLGGWSIYNKSGPKHQGGLLSTVIKVFIGPRPTTQSRRTTCCFISTNRSDREDDPVSLHEYSFVRHITAISITYIMLGIVSALGHTFFVEQANHMNRKLLLLTVPLAAFQLPMLVGTIAWPCFYTICHCLRWVNDYGRCIPECLRTIPSFLGIVQAMVHAFLCCVIAAAVEKRRLGVRSRHQDNDVVPMHATWLIFQFYLVGCVDFFFRSSIEAYYHAQAPGSLRDRYDLYTDFVSGLGFVSSVVLVAIVGKISEMGGKPNDDNGWFKESVNTSYLDRYYWLLAVLSSLSIVAFCMMAVFCLCKDVKPAQVDRQRDQRHGDGDGEGEQPICCFRR
ncbi:hypothetical protein C2S51_014574 [Perilla frutescens var. frutescens]|nr:hypothetical protein C2S51_014574 [Perilla frutescens var. frutescens]